MSGVSPTFFLLPHITFNNPLSLPPNVAGLRLLGPSASLRRLAASLRGRRHARRPTRRRPRLPNSLRSPPAEAGRGSGSSAPWEELRPRQPRGCGRSRAGVSGSPAPRVRGSDFGRRRERQCFLPPAALRGPRRRPQARAGRAGLLPPVRRPIPPSSAQALHLLSTEEEGRRKTVGPTPDMRGGTATSSKTTIKTSKGIKIDGLDSSKDVGYPFFRIKDLNQYSLIVEGR
jgi:hypothetical protein